MRRSRKDEGERMTKLGWRKRSVATEELKGTRICLTLIGLSAVVLILSVVLRVGIEATPSQTPDSSGRMMGFNDPLSMEHYRIMIRNFRVTALLRWEYAYEWALAAMHMLGAWLLLSPPFGNRLYTRWFFIVQ